MACPALPCFGESYCKLLFGDRQLSSCRSKDGSAEIQLGDTRVLASVSAELAAPYSGRPNEGSFSIFTEFSPMADPRFEQGGPSELAVELGRVVDRGLRYSLGSVYPCT